MSSLLLRLLLDFAAVGGLAAVHRAHHRHQADFVPAAVMLNVVTFALAFLMNRVPIDVGFGLGLFAIFGILRYRTEALRIRDVTYLFAAIGLAVINGLDNQAVELYQVALLNVAIVGSTVIIESLTSRVGMRAVRITYDRTDLLGGGEHEILVADLSRRLGMKVRHVHVNRVDLLKDTADLSLLVESER